MSLSSINPATGKRLRTYPAMTGSQIEAALTRANTAFLAWRETAPAERAQHLRAAARALHRRRDAFAELITTEMGKPITESRGEIEKCGVVCEFYAQHGARWLLDERPPGASREARVTFEPLGVVLAIMPWNFPFWQVFRAAVPALTAGNTVVLKHASNVTGCALAIEKVFREAGLPRGAFETLRTDTKHISALITDERVCGVTLTGSTRAGREVAALAGRALKPSVLELGGSDPYVILADADLDHAAAVCASARLRNSGQSCVCAKRFIVVESVRREFETKFVAHLADARVGDPRDPATDVGPLARADLREDLHAQVKKSIRRGARLLLGGAARPGPGFFYSPTALTDVRAGMPAYNEETFGPVAAIIPVRNEDAAIAAANDTIYGLGAALFTRNRRRWRSLAARIQAGQVFVNDYVRSDVALPFGGIKQSGYGRELGAWGLRSFMNTKTLWTR